MKSQEELIKKPQGGQQLPSTFSWLDSSEHERRRALDIIDLFGQSETVDELGLGTVRDAIAEVLSPGTSTVQTRARYFFFIPWIYQSLDRRSPIEKASDAARRLEVELIGSLSKAEDNFGAIGITVGAALQRLPSTIYWAGLQRLGFRIFPGSIDKYHRMLGSGLRVAAQDDAKDVLTDSPFKGNWHPHMPAAPTGFPGEASLELTRSEAQFFKEQLEVRAPESMLTFLVNSGDSLEGVDFPWMHPRLGEVSPGMRQWLIDGKNYSDLMSGAQFLYNLMLAEKKKEMSERVGEYQELLDAWAEKLLSSRTEYDKWDRAAFWQKLRRVNPGLPEGVRLFSEAWIVLAFSESGPRAVSQLAAARQLIERRESKLKGARARLVSQAHLDLWKGASGADPLNYRWAITKRIVGDIVAGLRQNKGSDSVRPA